MIAFVLSGGGSLGPAIEMGADTIYVLSCGFPCPPSANHRSPRSVLPFLSGYAVELRLLVGFAARYGVGRIGDVDLGARSHRNRPLRELATTSFEILNGAAALLEREGRTQDLQLAKQLHQPDAVPGKEIDIRWLPALDPTEDVLSVLSSSQVPVPA